jgi:hypothetical protein
LPISDEEFFRIVSADAPEVYRRCIKTEHESTQYVEDSNKLKALFKECELMFQELYDSQTKFDDEAQARNFEIWKREPKTEELRDNTLSSIRPVIDYIGRPDAISDLVADCDGKLTIENFVQVFERVLAECNEYDDLLSDWDKIRWEIVRTRMVASQTEIAMERERAEIASLQTQAALLSDLQSKINRKQKPQGVFSRIAAAFKGNQETVRELQNTPVRYECRKCRKISTYDRFARPESCCGERMRRMM